MTPPRSTARRANFGDAAAPSSRGRLVDAGKRLFRQHGYRRVSLDRILQESGVCRSNFYYHFRGKQSLALTVIDEWYADVHAEVVRPVLDDAGRAPLAKARAIVDHLIARLEELGCRGGCPFGTLASAEAEHDDTIRTKLVEVFDSFSRTFETLYAAAAERGELRADAPPASRLAAGTLAFLQGGALLSKTYADVRRLRFAAQTWFGLIETRAGGDGDSAEKIASM